MFEGMNMGDLGKMLEEMQQKARELEAKSESIELTARSGGGLVKVTANGKGEIIDIDIDDSLLDDKEALQILLISAINDVMKMVEDNKKSAAMSMFAGGLGPFGGGDAGRDR
ncbi:YbaB/EbfC family nucleoid-associated protein [Hydrogenimonas sp.]